MHRLHKMETGRDSFEEEEAKVKDLDKEIGKLRSAKNELFEKARPLNDELETIRQRERDLVDERERLTTKQHYQHEHQQTVQRVTELESQLKQAHSKIDGLKQSLDKATKQSKLQLRTIAEIRSQADSAQTLPKAVDSWTVGELQKQLNHATKLLNETKGELNETRQRLCEVQDRLTLAEQVTAATQRRALQEFDNSEQLQVDRVPPQQTTSSASACSLI